MKKKMVLLAAALTLLIILFSGCGGTSADPTDDTGDTISSDDASLSENDNGANDEAGDNGFTGNGITPGGLPLVLDLERFPHEEFMDISVLPRRDIAGSEIEWITLASEDAPFVIQIVELFERYYNATIRVSSRQGDWDSYIAGRLMAGNPPDVISMWAGIPLMYALRGYLMPLDDYIDLDSPLWAPTRHIFDSERVNGQIFSAPRNFTPWMSVFYNSDLLADAGLESPNELFKRGEWTFDKMNEFARAVIENNRGMDMTGVAISEMGVLVSILAAADTDLLVQEDGRFVPNLDCPRVTYAMNFLFDMFHEGLWHFYCFGADGAWNAFVTNQAAFLIISSARIDSSPLREMRIRGTAGFTQMPKFESTSRHILYVDGIFDGIFLGTNNFEASLAFVEFMHFNEHTASGRQELVRRQMADGSTDTVWNEVTYQMWLDSWGMGHALLANRVPAVLNYLYTIQRALSDGRPWAVMKPGLEPRIQRTLLFIERLQDGLGPDY